MKLYVGIDPSYTGTGIVVLNKDSGVLACTKVKAPSEGSDIMRALAVRNEVFEIITSCGAHVLGSNRPFVAIENYSLNSKFGLAMAATLGTVLRMGLIDRDWLYVEPSPQSVKAFALMAKGKGARSKKQKPVKEAQAIWGFKHKSNDVVDAYVLAQIARSAGGAHALGQLDARQLEVVAGLKVIC